MKKIICVHILNDYSGSPLVLSESVKAFIDAGYSVEIFTSRHTEGFLSNIQGVIYNYFNYKWSKVKLITLLYLISSQIELFFKLLKFRKEEVVIYVNTVLPFGAGLAGSIMGKKVVYHIHETSIRPAFLKKFLLGVIHYTASKVIYVSDYLRNKEALKGKKSHRVYNALSDEFINSATNHVFDIDKSKNVLMICSLKAYKGVNEFISIAALLPDFKFTLIVNSNQIAIDEYFTGVTIPANLSIYSAQKNVHLFYKEAGLLLNLSHPDKWIETFGMTVLEAMSYGIPVIVPPIGGVSELVEDGYNGYHMDARNLQAIKEHIEKIFSNKSLYNYLSFNARKKAKDFNIHTFRTEIISAVEL